MKYNALHPYFGDRYDLSNYEAFMIGHNKTRGAYKNEHHNKVV